MLEPLFGNINVERILFYLCKNEECYALELSRVLNVPLTSLQRALDRLEFGGIIASSLVGRTRVYRFDPRYPLLSELITLLGRAFTFLPKNLQNQYTAPHRRRPRKRGKERSIR